MILYILFSGCFLESVPANAFLGLSNLQRLKIQSPSPGVGIRIGAMDGIQSLRYLEVGFFCFCFFFKICLKIKKLKRAFNEIALFKTIRSYIKSEYSTV